MLKAVIQHQHLRTVSLACDVRGLDSIGSLQMRHARAELIEDELFVVRGAGVRPIATAQDGRTHAVRREPLDNGRDNGRLAGAPSGQVADADDGDRCLVRSEHADVEGRVTRSNRRAVKESSERQPAPRGVCQQPARAAGDQVAVAGEAHASSVTTPAPCDRWPRPSAECRRPSDRCGWPSCRRSRPCLPR